MKNLIFIMISVITLMSCTSHSSKRLSELAETDFTSANILDSESRLKTAVSCQACEIYFNKFVFNNPDKTKMSTFREFGLPVSIVTTKIVNDDGSSNYYTAIDTFEWKLINDTIFMDDGGYIAYYDANLIGFNAKSDRLDHSEE